MKFSQSTITAVAATLSLTSSSAVSSSSSSSSLLSRRTDNKDEVSASVSASASASASAAVSSLLLEIRRRRRRQNAINSLSSSTSITTNTIVHEDDDSHAVNKEEEEEYGNGIGNVNVNVNTTDLGMLVATTETSRLVFAYNNNPSQQQDQQQYQDQQQQSVRSLQFDDDINVTDYQNVFQSYVYSVCGTIAGLECSVCQADAGNPYSILLDCDVNPFVGYDDDDENNDDDTDVFSVFDFLDTLCLRSLCQTSCVVDAEKFQASMVDCSAEYLQSKYDLSLSTENYFNYFTSYCGGTTTRYNSSSSSSIEYASCDCTYDDDNQPQSFNCSYNEFCEDIDGLCGPADNTLTINICGLNTNSGRRNEDGTFTLQVCSNYTKSPYIFSYCFSRTDYTPAAADNTVDDDNDNDNEIQKCQMFVDDFECNSCIFVDKKDYGQLFQDVLYDCSNTILGISDGNSSTKGMTTFVNDYFISKSLPCSGGCNICGTDNGSGNYGMTKLPDEMFLGTNNEQIRCIDGLFRFMKSFISDDECQLLRENARDVCGCTSPTTTLDEKEEEESDNSIVSDTPDAAAAAAAANISTESSTGTSSTIYVSRNNTKTTLVLFVAVTSALTYIVASIS